MLPWTYKNETIDILPEKIVGFIYAITQISTGKMYFGKKRAFFKKTALKTITVKSTGLKKKKKIRSLVESDWRDYYGSSNSLKLEIEKCGYKDFTREILKFCKTETSLSYEEARIQFVNDVLLYPDKFFNDWIMVRCRRDHLLKTINIEED
jgi:hypothetical protein